MKILNKKIIFLVGVLFFSFTCITLIFAQSESETPPIIISEPEITEPEFETPESEPPASVDFDTPDVSDTPFKQNPKTSYVIVHALNPEGIEIASIKGISHQSVEIYDGDTLIGYGAYNEETHNKSIPILTGTHIIKTKFNGITKEQKINLNPDETKTVIFTFERTEFDLWDKIPKSYQTTVDISGSWVGRTPLTEDVAQDNLGWYLRVHFMEPYDGGYDKKGNYIRSSGSYEAVARTKWTKEANKLEYKLHTNYDIYITPVPGRPYLTPYWSSLVDGLASFNSFPLELNNPNFSNWFIQYSNYCIDLSLQIGGLELLDFQNSYIVKSVPTVNADMHIKSDKIETWGSAWYPITKTGGGELNIKMSSVPYDLTGTGIKDKENQPPRCDFSTQPNIERCFGGIGTQCEGDAPWPGVKFDRHEDTCLVSGWMSVGSILHDQCCVRTGNTGYRCANPTTRKCNTDWALAKGDVICQRFWEKTFGPYPAGNTGDDTSKDLKAPSGARVHPKQQSFCQSGQCQVNAKGKTIIQGKGLCKYCVCQ